MAEIHFTVRDLYPGREYAKQWNRERRLEAALQEREAQKLRSKWFWAWLRQQTRDLTVSRYE